MLASYYYAPSITKLLILFSLQDKIVRVQTRASKLADRPGNDLNMIPPVLSLDLQRRSKQQNTTFDGKFMNQIEIEGLRA